MLLFESAKSFSVFLLLTGNVNCLLLTVAAYTLFIISVSSVNHNLIADGINNLSAEGLLIPLR